MSRENTRDHIVEAADDLIYWQGYESTSFADIAEAVRISAAISTITSKPRTRSWTP